MTRLIPLNRQAGRRAILALRIVTLATLALAASLLMVAQTQKPAPRVSPHALLARAHAQEETGHIDLAAQTWQQVLLVDGNDQEALAGLARAAKKSGDGAASRTYLDRLRRINPQSPEIAKIETTSTSKVQNAQLQKAAQLAQAGHPDEALRIYRSVWGPPARRRLGPRLLRTTEAGTEAGRPDAITSLRALATRYPADTRYNITLGRILTYTPRSPPRRHPSFSSASPVMPPRSRPFARPHLWTRQDPNAAQGIRAYLQQHPDEQIAQSLAEAQARRPNIQPTDTGIARTPAESKAFASLAANRVDDAEQQFLVLQADQPDNPRVLAGLGFLRMKQNNFPAAVDLSKAPRRTACTVAT